MILTGETVLMLLTDRQAVRARPLLTSLILSITVNSENLSVQLELNHLRGSSSGYKVDIECEGVLLA